MNIGMTHFRVGETDGVSLEMDKWKRILENNGHKVFYIAGSSAACEALIIPQLSYRDKQDAEISAECFESNPKLSEISVKEKISKLSKEIENEFVKLIRLYDIDLIIPNNLLSLGRGLQIAIGLTNAIIKTGIKVVGHHHDFYWERDYFDHPNYDFVKELLEEYCPPKEIENMKHVVINKLAQNDLLEKKGLNSDVVPNVFDFDAPLWVEDDYNKTYRNDMGLKDNQVVFLQATRVTNRKAIELAIDLIALLNKEEFKQKLIGKQLYNGKAFNKDTELVLAMVGMHEGGEGYEEKIIQYAKENDVNLIVKPELIAHARHLEDGKKVYSLWDAYVHCDMITYPSIYEGWGNQFLEGLFAKKPQIVFEYSVFESDIISYDFDYISLGNEYKVGDKSLAKISDIVLRKAANETIEYLTNKDKYSACVSKNFKIAKKELSLDSLERVIIPIVDGVKR